MKKILIEIEYPDFIDGDFAGSYIVDKIKDAMVGKSTWEPWHSIKYKVEVNEK